MSGMLNIKQRNGVLFRMAELVGQNREKLYQANQTDMQSFDRNDLAMFDRLKVDSDKIDDMILSLKQLAEQADPVGVERFHFQHENGLDIYNKTASFGTVLIIYESRPDVTIEAAGIAFKSGNRILLKGGKESLNSNLALVNLWHQALDEFGIEKNWVEYLNFNRDETQAFLKTPDKRIDLIIPRGGEKLIAFVKQHATCPVVVSGRGNNFIYVDRQADQEMAIEVIVNSKTSKISACNALDKVLIDKNMPDFDNFLQSLIEALYKEKVQILVDPELALFENVKANQDEQLWYEEFLELKILLGLTASTMDAVEKINRYGGGHSASIITKDLDQATLFLDSVDSAAVYHNASTRFTDGFQFGLGGELAISTDKLHQRGPIGLNHLVTNKWYVYGEGQIR